MTKLKRGFSVFFKLVGISFLFFLSFNIILYSYCYITPKISIHKTQSYYLYDNQKKLIFNDNDEWVDLDNISPYLIQATLSTEDKYFYQHLGFDYFRIIKAAIKNLQSRSLREGASTITQQYARNLFLNYDKTWSRKIDEAILAAELETHYSKKEILEGYLNTINYGGVYGIENASWYYFGHSSKTLSLAESSMLAGIPQSPSNYSPIINENKAKKRQKIVLLSMYNRKIIQKEEMDNAINYSLEYIGKTNQSNLENVLYFRDAVIDELESINIPNSTLQSGGLKIYTTLDVKAQESLEKAIRDNMDDNTELQVAGMMSNPNDGSIIALIGGKDYSKSQFNRAINAKRQVGSTMKPILYYSALENGFTSASCFTSEKTTFNFSNGKNYTPSNYNESYANSSITMGAAISYSDNVYAVKTHLFLGENTLVNMSHRLGIESKLFPNPSLALGTGEMKMIELIEAYSTFANMGNQVKQHFIEKIEDSSGKIIYQFSHYNEKILNKSLTFILNEMLTYTYDKSFVNYNYPTVISLLPKISNKYAIKTGTTDTDVWIVGYNKNAVLSIWNGYDNNKKIDTGEHNYHKNIWIDTMENYLKDKDNSWYDIPDDVVGTLVNPITGELAKEGDKNTKIFYFLKGTEPSYGTKDFETVFKEENEKKFAS
ncbi:MAG: PBP1A family penicillin-binding protein [Bacilli bacterium]|nr:PBP1A family penicillin-binding protein [Bacilli bacterium]